MSIDFFLIIKVIYFYCKHLKNTENDYEKSPRSTSKEIITVYCRMYFFFFSFFYNIFKRKLPTTLTIMIT